MLREEALKLVGQQVRIRPTDGRRHFTPARLLEVFSKTALVQPHRHQGSIRVDLEQLHEWKGGNPELYQYQPVTPQPQEQTQQEKPMPGPVATSQTRITDPTMYSPQLYVEAMAALKELADAEQMAKDAALEVVKARQRWLDLKAKIDKAATA